MAFTDIPLVNTTEESDEGEITFLAPVAKIIEVHKAYKLRLYNDVIPAPVSPTAWIFVSDIDEPWNSKYWPQIEEYMKAITFKGGRAYDDSAIKAFYDEFTDNAKWDANNYSSSSYIIEITSPVDSCRHFTLSIEFGDAYLKWMGFLHKDQVDQARHDMEFFNGPSIKSAHKS